MIKLDKNASGNKQFNIKGTGFDIGCGAARCLRFKKTEEVTHNTVVWTPAWAFVWTPAGAFVSFIDSHFGTILRAATLATE
jgi:hypothetical protein